MSEFNEKNWKEALTELYQRSISDADFRQLCLTDPLAAIKEVSDIEIPANVIIQFFDDRAKFPYSFLLPPTQAEGGADPNQIVRWATFCTDATTWG